MIRSMTGYGKAIAEIEGKKFTIEVRSLNSKQFDLNLRMPGIYKEKELELRNSLRQQLERGKVEFSIYYEASNETQQHIINAELLGSYYKNIVTAADQSSIPHNENTDFLNILMRLPDVMKTDRPDFNEEEWKQIIPLTEQAVNAFNNFREVEGKALQNDLELRVQNILTCLTEIEVFEPQRVEKIRQRIQTSLKDNLEGKDIDNNRFEQEMILYLEKLDITEEKVRLRQHGSYFSEILENETAQGKKLGFVAQEIGREINTIGSKANNADIQQKVVQMKDELEKIKEQVLNVL